MLDIAALQKKLNSDRTLRDRFGADPAGVLRDAGVPVTAEHEVKLRDLIAQASKPGLPTQASALDWSVSINISIPFDVVPPAKIGGDMGGPR